MSCRRPRRRRISHLKARAQAGNAPGGCRPWPFDLPAGGRSLIRRPIRAPTSTGALAGRRPPVTRGRPSRPRLADHFPRRVRPPLRASDDERGYRPPSGIRLRLRPHPIFVITGRITACPCLKMAQHQTGRRITSAALFTVRTGAVLKNRRTEMRPVFKSSRAADHVLLLGVDFEPFRPVSTPLQRHPRSEVLSVD